MNILEDHQEIARNQMSQKTMAAIMWIIQLQARTFFGMEMTTAGEDVVRDDFTPMLHDLRVNVPNIQHSTLLKKGRKAKDEEEKKEEEKRLIQKEQDSQSQTSLTLFL